MIIIVTNALTRPRKNPAVTCVSVCCRKIMRLEPTTPDAIMVRQSHQMGLKLSTTEKAMSPPRTPPMPAVCVEIFHQTLIMAHNT